MSSKALAKVQKKFKKIPSNGKYPMTDIPLFGSSLMPIIVELEGMGDDTDAIGFVYSRLPNEETVSKALTLYTSLLNLHRYTLKEESTGEGYWITQGNDAFGGIMIMPDDDGTLSLCVYLFY